MPEKLCIRNSRVLLPDGEITDCDLYIHDGVIAGIDTCFGGLPQINASGAYVLPGLIDIHTHGIGYETVAEGSLAAYAGAAAAHGATTFVPTFFASPAKIIEQMQRHRRETKELELTPQVAGFRLESPYLFHPGGGVSADTSPISAATTAALLEAGGGHIKIWDISPELPGAADTVRQLSTCGIICSIAHTFATVEQARTMVEAGACLIAHLFNAFGTPSPVETGVYPAGLIDYLLVEDRVICEIIGDGTHVDPLLVEKAFRCKSPDGLAFVTDGNMGAGLPAGTYELPSSRGTILVDGPNDGVRQVDRDMLLAGSALTPLDAFRNVYRLFGKSLAVASKVCSSVPAGLLKLNKGEIAEGRDADLIILDERLELLYTIVRGSMVYLKKQ